MNTLKFLAGLLYSNDKLVSVVGETAENGGIESGSNANGYWVKYPDGTMICSFSDTVLRTTSNVFGSIYSSAYFSLTFPVPFIATPIVTSGATIGSGRVWSSLAPNNNASVACYLLGSANTNTGYVTYTAVGRWK